MVQFNKNKKIITLLCLGLFIVFNVLGFILYPKIIDKKDVVSNIEKYDGECRVATNELQLNKYQEFFSSEITYKIEEKSKDYYQLVNRFNQIERKYSGTINEFCNIEELKNNLINDYAQKYSYAEEAKSLIKFKVFNCVEEKKIFIDNVMIRNNRIYWVIRLIKNETVEKLAITGDIKNESNIITISYSIDHPITRFIKQATLINNDNGIYKESILSFNEIQLIL